MILKRKICVKTRQRVKSFRRKSCSLRLHVYVKWAGFNLWSVSVTAFRSVSFQASNKPYYSSSEVLQTPGHWMLTRHSCITLVCSGADILSSGFSSQTIEQIFRLSQLLLSRLFILRLKKLNFIPTGSSGQGGSILFAVFPLSLMFLQASSEKWLFPTICVFFAVITPWCTQR